MAACMTIGKSGFSDGWPVHRCVGVLRLCCRVASASVAETLELSWVSVVAKVVSVAFGFAGTGNREFLVVRFMWLLSEFVGLITLLVASQLTSASMLPTNSTQTR